MAGLTEGMSFHLPLTQDLLADALGLTAIHVNRTLRTLREDNFLKVEDKRITILKFECRRGAHSNSSYLGGI